LVFIQHFIPFGVVKTAGKAKGFSDFICGNLGSYAFGYPTGHGKDPDRLERF